MSPRSITLTDPLHGYLLAHSLRETEVMQRLRSETQRLGDDARMQIAPEQGQFMALLVRLISARRVLEIGTFTGYSALAMAAALPPDGRLVALDMSQAWTDIARRFWDEAGVAGRIDLRLGPAADSLAALERAGGEPFDLAFIDADKTSYPAYYESCLRLLRPGGLIMVDNVLRGGGVVDPDDRSGNTEAIRAFNTQLKDDTRIDLSMVPMGDGLTLARKR